MIYLAIFRAKQAKIRKESGVPIANFTLNQFLKNLFKEKFQTSSVNTISSINFTNIIIFLSLNNFNSFKLN